MSPVPDTIRPFHCHIHRSQIEHLGQCFISWEDALAFGYFPELAMIALDRIRINESHESRYQSGLRGFGINVQPYIPFLIHYLIVYPL